MAAPIKKPAPKPKTPQSQKPAGGQGQENSEQKKSGALSYFKVYGTYRKYRPLIKKHRDALRPNYTRGMYLMSGVFFLDLLTLVLGLFGIGEVLDTIIDYVEDWVLPIPYLLLGLKIEPESYIATAILELIPFVDLLPLWTYQAAYTLLIAWVPQIDALEEQERQALEQEMQNELLKRQEQALRNQVSQEPAGGIRFSREGAHGDYDLEAARQEKQRTGVVFDRAASQSRSSAEITNPSPESSHVIRDTNFTANTAVPDAQPNVLRGVSFGRGGAESVKKAS